MAVTINGSTGIEYDDNFGNKYGDSDDLQIRHNSSGKSVIYHSHASEPLSIAGDHLQLADHANEHKFIYCDRDAGVDIYYDNTKRFEVVSDGIRWTGHCYANDNYKLRLGTGEDLQIYHDGSDSYIQDTGTGFLKISGNQIQIKADDADEKLAVFDAHGAVELYYDNTKRLETTASGVNIPGGQYLQVKHDTGRLTLGAGDDLQIYHNGSHSFIQNSTGNLYIWGADGHDGNIVIQATYGEESIICNHNGGVNIYHDNSKKFETNSNGIEVFDNVKCTGNRGTHYAFSAYGTTSTGSQYYMTFRRSDDTHDGYIVSTSDGAISLAQGSDYRLKENIVSMTNGIDIVKKLNPVTYKFKGKTDTLQGFIAHEVDDAGILNGVIGTKDAVDSDDKPIYQGVSVDKLIPALTAGLKEAIAKIETLETKVAALEAA